MVGRVLTIVSLTILCGACQRGYEIPAPPKPDLSESYSEVQKYLNEERSAVEAAPASANAWGHFAMALDAHEYSEEAIQCYRVASTLDPKLAKWKYLLARKVRARSPEQAESLLAQITDSPTASLARLVCHADLLDELGRSEAAQQLLSKAAAASPENPAVLFRKANVTFEEGRYEMARETLARIEGDFRETERLKARLAALDTKVESTSSVSEEAAPSVDQTIEDRDLADVLNCRRDPLWLGKRAAERAGAGDQLSLITLTGLVTKHPELTDNRLLLASLLQQYGDREQAERIILQGLEQSPENSRLLAESAALAILNLEWTVAEERLRRLLKSFPQHGAAWSDLAFVLEQQSRLEEALDAYDKALLYAPTDSQLIDRRNALMDTIEKGRLP